MKYFTYTMLTLALLFGAFYKLYWTNPERIITIKCEQANSARDCRCFAKGFKNAVNPQVYKQFAEATTIKEAQLLVMSLSFEEMFKMGNVMEICDK